MKLFNLVLLMFLLPTLPGYSQTTPSGGTQIITMLVTFVLVIGMWFGGFYVFRAAVKGGAIRAFQEYFGEKPPTFSPPSTSNVASENDNTL